MRPKKTSASEFLLATLFFVLVCFASEEKLFMHLKCIPTRICALIDFEAAVK
jgi:hypothetical protein